MSVVNVLPPILLTFTSLFYKDNTIRGIVNLVI